MYSCTHSFAVVVLEQAERPEIAFFLVCRIWTAAAKQVFRVNLSQLGYVVKRRNSIALKSILDMPHRPVLVDEDILCLALHWGCSEEEMRPLLQFCNFSPKVWKGARPATSILIDAFDERVDVMLFQLILQKCYVDVYGGLDDIYVSLIILRITG